MDRRTAELIGTHNVFAGLWHNLSQITDSIPCAETRRIVLSVLHAMRKSARIIRERVLAEYRGRLYTPWSGSHGEPAVRHMDSGLDTAQALWIRDVLLEVYRIVGDLHDAVHGMWLQQRVHEAQDRVVRAMSAFTPVFVDATR
jgi:hypothetical protein